MEMSDFLSKLIALGSDGSLELAYKDTVKKISSADKVVVLDTG